MPSSPLAGNRNPRLLDSRGPPRIVLVMKSLAILIIAAIACGLTSCSAANGLAKTLSRTGNSLSRSVSNLGGALTR
jgi:predicted small secreted protein